MVSFYTIKTPLSIISIVLYAEKVEGNFKEIKNNSTFR
ncbi:hypothetical protein bcere0025_55620 [Bacillus cereus F65185]|nr:hypothetical protein bcere0025_55620 [Bacillus cereus F65185]EEM38267.1 hypothetical protein bthur0004_58270 [Bacillus thuringiensis serovar sotto str. T04001]